MTAPGGKRKSSWEMENCYYYYCLLMYFSVYGFAVSFFISAHIYVDVRIFYLISLLRDIHLVSRTASLLHEKAISHKSWQIKKIIHTHSTITFHRSDLHSCRTVMNSRPSDIKRSSSAQKDFHTSATSS